MRLGVSLGTKAATQSHLLNGTRFQSGFSFTLQVGFLGHVYFCTLYRLFFFLSCFFLEISVVWQIKDESHHRMVHSFHTELQLLLSIDFSLIHYINYKKVKDMDMQACPHICNPKGSIIVASTSKVASSNLDS